MKRSGWFGLVAAVAVALAACSGSSAGGTPTPTASPATAAGVASLFTASEDCHDVPTASPDPVTEVTPSECVRTASDARLSGTARGSVSTSGTDPVVTAMYGAMTYTNNGGTWRCEFLALGTLKNGVGGRDEVCVGGGGYAGLTAYVHAISGDTASTWGGIGFIESTK